MRVVIVCESQADEAALTILAEAILKHPIEPATQPRIETRRGWPGVLNLVDPAIKHAHYNTDAEGFVVVADSNSSPRHRPAGHSDDGERGKCRYCQIRNRVDVTLSHLRAIPGRPAMKTAIGIAVPAIEAWYRVGIDPAVRESAWMPGHRSSPRSYTKESLKRSVYGIDRPNRAFAKERATDEARRLADPGLLADLEARFAIGFGLLAEALQTW